MNKNINHWVIKEKNTKQKVLPTAGDQLSMARQTAKIQKTRGKNPPEKTHKDKSGAISTEVVKL